MKKKKETLYKARITAVIDFDFLRKVDRNKAFRTITRLINKKHLESAVYITHSFINIKVR